MFGTRLLSLARYLRISGRSIHSMEACWSKILATKCSRFERCRIFWKSFNNSGVNNSWFKPFCCLPDKHGSISDDSKLISQHRDSRITVGTTNKGYDTNDYTSENIVDFASYDRTGVHLRKSEFLGIEVFPEIFDQLPPKCTGCGAILQSQYQSKPGFIPENQNPNFSRNLEEKSFRSEVICSRCFSLKHYNMEAHSLVLPNIISTFLSHICRRKALILYVVNVMDIPGSFATNILKIVGETKHIILVCNKVDQLPVDGHPASQIQRVKQIISEEAKKFGLHHANVLEVSAISAKTGFGIHDLVKAINKYWKRKDSDIYFVGCHNSGKTTLFNLLFDLFTASRQMDNMLQRGTVSPSPGTTLSLLRQPITKHRFLRLQNRLRNGFSESQGKEHLREVDVNNDVIDKQMTKYHDNKESKIQSSFTSVMPYQLEFVTLRRDQKPDDLCWLYDTPGLFNKNQITHLLTNQELKLLNPTLWFVPRTVILRPGKVLFLGGLARLDYLHVTRHSRFDPGKKDDVPKTTKVISKCKINCPPRNTVFDPWFQASQSIFFTIFASPNLPIHITSLGRADSLYKEHAGEELFKIPTGGKTRMAEFPPLAGCVFEVTGVDWKRSAADVILSNIGWIAVTAGSGSVVSLKAYTPGAAGLYLREPALLPTSVRQRGRRGVPYLGHVNHNMYQGTRKRSPALTKYFKEQNLGTTQWMKVAEMKRRQQRAWLKFEKTQCHSKLRLGFSARSNPGKYLADYENDLLSNSGKDEALQQIESGRLE